MRHHSFAGMPAWIVLVVLLTVTAAPQPAAAQSLFQTIFGFLGPKKKTAPPQLKSSPNPVDRNGNLGRTNPFSNQPRQSYVPQSGGRLRTVCVRLCDGYYFPISNSSRRRDFYRDAQACQSRCQTETRLYHMPASNPSIKYARDRRGFAYKDLKTAFLYRKKLSKSCTCRPEPWTVAERMRHKGYELPEPTALASLGSSENTESDAGSIAGRPQLVRQSDQLSPPAPRIAVPRVPPPRAVAAPLRAPRPARVTRKRAKKPAMGLGAAFGGAPKVKYRHKWSDVLD